MVFRLSRCVISILLLLVACVARAEVTVEGAWVRQVPPVSSVTAAYMRITNQGSSAVSLVGATSPQAQMVEIHEVVAENGHKTMQTVERVELIPGDVAVFRPGGLHFMLMGYEPPRGGVSNSLIMVFSDGSRKEVTLVSRKSAPASD